MYPSNLSSHSLILSSHPHHILRVSVHLHQSISLLAISQAITHIGRCKSIAYRDCFHTKGTTHRIVHSQSCTWSVHMHITISPLNLDTSVCIACIYNKSMRSLTQRYIYTRLRMNRLKCWSSYVWISILKPYFGGHIDVDTCAWPINHTLNTKRQLNQMVTESNIDNMVLI